MEKGFIKKSDKKHISSKNQIRSKRYVLKYILKEKKRMFDVDFLNGVLSNEEMTPEQRVQTIITEHEASERGLVQKKNELLGNEKKLKEQISNYESKGKEYDAKIAELNEQLKKNNPAETQKYYESQLELLKGNQAKELESLTKERDFYRNSHYEMLKSNAINEGVKDFQFVDGLKDGFVSLVMMKNNFVPKDINGQIIFLNDENKTIPEVMKDFANTSAGKAYIKNPSSGAGTHTSSGNGYAGGQTMTRSEFDKLRSENPQKVSEFFQKGGKIID